MFWHISIGGKIHALVWDFPTPIIPCEESPVWLWHICFPTFLQRLSSPSPDSEVQELRTDVTFTHQEVCFLEVWRHGTEMSEERGLWGMLNLLFQRLFFNFFLTLYCRLLQLGVCRLLSRTQTVTCSWTQHRLFYCLDGAVVPQNCLHYICTVLC